MITTKQAFEKYGVPSDNPKYLVTIKLPYPMRLSWDKETKVTKMRCHKLVADKFDLIFKELLNYYSYEKIVELGIDLFGGCFNFRKMRGGSDYSRHSWGIAIDLDPERNGMNTPVTKAQFNKPEYKPMIEIFKKNGFNWAGYMWKKDAMHWEIAE